MTSAGRRFLNADERRERHDAAYYLFEVYLKPCEPVEVKDGFLDIELIHRIEHPKISAIEIERVR